VGEESDSNEFNGFIEIKFLNHITHPFQVHNSMFSVLS
jgi:hypothetical protein